MNGRIDWDKVEGRARVTREPLVVRAAAPQFSQEQIDAACAACNAMPGGNKIPTPWDRADDLPDIDDLDFEGMKPANVKIGDLLASDKNVKRDKVIWHIQNPGQRRNPLLSKPFVASTHEGDVIVDGHHFLFAQQLLGQKNADVFRIPTK